MKKKNTTEPQYVTKEILKKELTKSEKRLFFHNEPRMIEKLIKFKTKAGAKPQDFFCCNVLFIYCNVNNTALRNY